MIGATLAIGDFMLMLMSAVFWAGAGLAGTAALYAGAAGGIFLTARRFLRRGR